MTESKRINTMIVEDHELMASSIREVLRTTVSRVNVVAIARNADEARVCADAKDKDNKIDLVIMDVRIKSDLDGISLAAELIKKLPNLMVLIYSGEDNEELVRRALSADVCGYVSKGARIEDLKNAIEIIAEGGIYLDPSLPKPRREIESLTPKEEEVLKLIAKGKNNEEICQELYPVIVPPTLKTHRFNIMYKRRLKNAVELYQYAIKCYPN